jgi:hypothetical protein
LSRNKTTYDWPKANQARPCRRAVAAGPSTESLCAPRAPEVFF